MSAPINADAVHDAADAPATPRPRGPRTRDRRIGVVRVLIVTAFFVVVLSANLFIGGVVLVGGLNENGGLGAYRVGRMTFPLFDGTFCRHILFDNETLQTEDDKVSACVDITPPRPGRRTRFNWGK
jgi:hypothetical protein